MPAGHIWTEDEVEQVKALITQDLSAAGIAKAMGETRNSIMGIIHRRHLKLRNPPPRNGVNGKKSKKKKGEKVPKQSKIPGVLAAEKTTPSGPKPIAEPPPEAHPCQMRRVPLIDLERNECKWPVDFDPTVIGGHLFCGRPTKVEQSYCDKHGARAAPPLRGGGLE